MAVADAVLDALDEAGIAPRRRRGPTARLRGRALARPARAALDVGGRDVLLDGAHNPAGAAALAAALDDLRPFLDGGRTPSAAADARPRLDGRQGRRRRDRGPAAADRARGARVIATPVDVPRALPAEDLAGRWRALGGVAGIRTSGRSGRGGRRPRDLGRRRSGRRRRLALPRRGRPRPARRRPAAARPGGRGDAIGPAHDRPRPSPARERGDQRARSSAGGTPPSRLPRAGAASAGLGDDGSGGELRLGRAHVRHGHRQRHARLVLRRRPAGADADPAVGGGRRPAAGDGRGRRRPPRRRRRVHPTRPRPRRPGEESSPASSR